MSYLACGRIWVSVLILSLSFHSVSFSFPAFLCTCTDTNTNTNIHLLPKSSTELQRWKKVLHCRNSPITTIVASTFGNVMSKKKKKQISAFFIFFFYMKLMLKLFFKQILLLSQTQTFNNKCKRVKQTNDFCIHYVKFIYISLNETPYHVIIKHYFFNE